MGSIPLTFQTLTLNTPLSRENKMTLTSIENLPISLSDKENAQLSKEKNGKVPKKDITETAMAVDFSQEPLLKDNPNRFVILPIQYDDIWSMYKKAQGLQLIINYQSSRCKM